MKTIIFNNCTYDELKQIEGLVLSTGLTIYSITWDLLTNSISVIVRDNDTKDTPYDWNSMFQGFNLDPVFKRLRNN